MAAHDGHRERLRNRYLKSGFDRMSDEQVLELLLFYALPRCDTAAVSKRLLDSFGSLSNVLCAPLDSLTAVEGIGEKAALLLTMISPLSQRIMLEPSKPGMVLRSLQECAAFLVPYFHGSKTEKVHLLCMDAKCMVLSCHMLEEGSTNSTGFSIRKAVQHALNNHATSVILSHNHPCGILEVSTADIETTRQFRDALAAVDIHLADHIIISGSSYFSMAEHSMI